MPIVVHVAAAKNARSIVRSGIKQGEKGVVYFMPVVQSHLVSHQWLRELKRFSGARELIGIYARLSSDEMVWSGRFNETHKQGRLGDAIAELNGLEDPLGFEMFVERKITAKEVQHVRSLPQVLGWRYQPHAHGKKPCPCPACLVKGSVRSKQIRLRLEGPSPRVPSLTEALAKLAEATDSYDIQDCLWPMRTKRRYSDPRVLQALLTSTDEMVLEEVAITLPYFRHPATPEMLRQLIAAQNPRVAELAAEALDAYMSGGTSTPGAA